MPTEKKHHPIVQLAKDSVEYYIKEGKLLATPPELTPEMREQAGVFVCLKKDGDLRGCIGTFMPTTPCVAEEVIKNAVSAAVEDPRFMCVECQELEELHYSVDVLTSPEPVKSLKDLDPQKYGIIVQSGQRRGLLLPDLEGVDTIEQQVAITKRKAGIEMHEPVTIYRFQVKRYE